MDTLGLGVESARLFGSAGVEAPLFIIQDRPRHLTTMRKPYRPLARENSAMFLAFADVHQTEDVLYFAGRYGLLGVGPQFVRPPDADLDVPDFYQGHIGEPIDAWKHESEVLRHHVQLWLGHRREPSWLNPDPRLSGSTGHRLVQSYARWLESPGERRRWQVPANIADDTELDLPVFEKVVTAIDTRLKHCRPHLVLDQTRRELVFVHRPESLLGALWIQFAEAVHGRKEFRQCRECNNWFELAPEVARTNRLYCSIACRSRAYRKRQAKARELSEQGIDVGEIAKRLGTDIETARRWIVKGEH